GLRKPYEEYFTQNKRDPNGALNEQLLWWKSLKEPPSHEEVTFYENAPLIREHLSKDRVLGLSVAELAELFGKTHATINHVAKISPSDLGRPDASHLDIPTRMPLFAELLSKARNRKGWDVRKLLNFVLYEGKESEMWERLYRAG